VYNKGFLPAYTMKQFRLVDYSNPKVLSDLQIKKSKDLKPHERFVLKVTGEYGCKDYYIFKDIQEYNTGDNFAASDSSIEDDNSDY